MPLPDSIGQSSKHSSDASDVRPGSKDARSLVASEMTCESPSQVQRIERGTSRRCVPSCAVSEYRTHISKEPFPWQLRKRRRPRRSRPRRLPRRRRSNWPGGRRGRSSSDDGPRRTLKVLPDHSEKGRQRSPTGCDRGRPIVCALLPVRPR